MLNEVGVLFSVKVHQTKWYDDPVLDTDCFAEIWRIFSAFIVDSEFSFFRWEINTVAA